MSDKDAEKVSRTDCTPWRDEETLRHFYHGKGYSLLETAEVVGCSEGTVSQWCNRLGVETRDAQEARDTGTPEDFKDEERMRELYRTLEMTCAEIADHYDVTPLTVSRWLRRHDIPTRPRNRRRNRVELECEACGSKYEVIACRSDSAKYCSRSCYYDGMDMPTGSDHWSWNGGGGPRYGRGWNEEKRERVRERDGNECRHCGLTQEENLRTNGCKLHVHHEVDPRDATNPAVYNAARNLVALCNSCHRSAHAGS